MASAGSIVIDLLARTGAFETDINRATKTAERRMREMEKSVKMAAVAVGAAVAGVGIAFMASMRNVIATADETEKAAQKLGLTGEALTSLRHAADLSGVSAEQLSQGITRLNKAAAGGSTALDVMGVSARDANGALKSSDAILKEVAGKFASYADGAAKSALAQELFGRSGAELIPLLNAGADGINAMQQEAADLGLVLDQQTRKAAEAFNDNLTRLNRTQEGVVTQLTAQMLPTLATLTDMLVDVAKNSDAVNVVSSGMATVFETVAVMGVNLKYVLVQIGKEIGGIAAQAAALMRFDFAAAGAIGDMMKSDAASARAEVDAMTARILGARSASSISVSQPSSPTATTRPDAPSVRTRSATSPRASSRSSAMTEEQKEYNRLMQEGARIYDSTRTAAEKLSIEFERLNELRDAGAITQDTYNRAIFDAQENFDTLIAKTQELAGDGEDSEGGYWEKWLAGAEEALTTFDELANSVIDNFASGFGSAFETMIFDSENLGESLKGMAEGMARSVVNALGQMAAQWLAYQAVQMLVGKTTAASAAGAKTFEAMAAQQMAALNAFAATAAIPIVGPAMAPAAAGAALAATSPFVATVASLSAAAVGARADGGPVSQGMPYLIGERGPELFVPGTSGAVVPNNKIGGGNVTVNLIEDKRRAGQTQERDNNGARELDVFVADIMGDGPRSKALRQAFGLQRRGY